MLVLLGQVETDFLGREAFQEVDLSAFYAPITKWAATVHRPDRLAEFVARGLRVATSGRPGPVMLALPADVLGEAVRDDRAEVHVTPRSALAPEDVRTVAGRLAAARRPVVIAGGGAKGARESLISFSQAWGAGVYAAFRRQDVFPNEHPNYLGHLTLGTPQETLKCLEEADLVLVVGCRLSEVTTQSYSLPCGDQAVIQIDIDPNEVGATVPAEIGMVSEADTALAALAEQAPSSPPARDWAEGHRAYLDSSTIPPDRAREGIDPARVVGAMRDALPEDALLTNDAGNFSVFIHRYWRYNHPSTQLASTNGAMGYGVPAAVAAKLAAPDRTVVACCGDGGFLMTGQEIETAISSRLPQSTTRHHSDAPEAGARPHGRRRDRGGGPRRLRQEPRRRRPHRARPGGTGARYGGRASLRHRHPARRRHRPRRYHPFDNALRDCQREPLKASLPRRCCFRRTRLPGPAVNKGKNRNSASYATCPLFPFLARAALKSGMVPKVGTPETCSTFSGERRPLR
jgi:thiamine pyrophosphate-dependent acetolactate synthase large subunit-like protein